MIALSDYQKEDCLKYTCESFVDNFKMKLQQLRTYIPKGTNPTLTGAYIESVVRSQIQMWIRNLRICNGTFFSEEFKNLKVNSLQIDGIIYDPSAGPTILDLGDFIIVHPAFCTNVIEIKTSLNSIRDFEKRLLKVHRLYFHHMPHNHVMGIVIHDKEPDKISNINNNENLYDFNTANICPIFVLFKELNDDYEPFYPAIKNMIKAMYLNTYISDNHIPF